MLLGGLDLAKVHKAALSHNAWLLHGPQVCEMLVPAASAWTLRRV